MLAILARAACCLIGPALGDTSPGLSGHTAEELVVTLSHGGGFLGLSTVGPAAFRVRYVPTSASSSEPVDTPMVKPDAPDAPFKKHISGISAAFGSIDVSPKGELQLFDAAGKLLTRSLPIGPSNDTCTARPGTDISSGERIDGKAALTVDSQASCCAACKAAVGCSNWVYGHPGDAEGNCWLLKSIGGTTPSATRTLGGAGGAGGLVLSTSSSAKLYGRGGGKADASQLTATGASAYVDNTQTCVPTRAAVSPGPPAAHSTIHSPRPPLCMCSVWIPFSHLSSYPPTHFFSAIASPSPRYAPHYYSTDGYACLAVVATTTGNGKSNVLAVSYSSDGSHIAWSASPKSPLELYLMPAASLDLGTEAYYSTTGLPAVPPRWAFGFIASRWGWGDSAYIEQVGREGSYRVGGKRWGGRGEGGGRAALSPALILTSSLILILAPIPSLPVCPTPITPLPSLPSSSSPPPRPRPHLDPYP